MRRSLPFAILASAFAAVALAAQAPSTSSQPATASGAPNHVTVTGCIQRADAVPSSPNAPADPDSLQYVLVRPNPEQSSSGAAAPATTGTTGTSNVLYRLSGDQQKLNPHVGHKVEITGSPSAVTPPAAAATGAATMPAGSAPGLMVENVRMIDASCNTK